jgi:maltose alpha-D-glucosyltransferase/alpha-amylase
MLAFFILEKAVCEVSYDLANRPNWVGVPIRAVLDILTKGRAGARARSA